MSVANGFVNVQFLNAAFVDMTKHWICNVGSMHNVLERTLFVALDLAALDALRHFESSLNVVLVHFGDDKNERGHGELVFAQASYFRTIEWRTSMIDRLLRRNVSLFLTEADSAWLRNAFDDIDVLNVSHDIVVLDDAYVRNGNVERRRVTGGFLYLRPTRATKALWREVARQQRVAVNKKRYLPGASSMADVGANEQPILTAVSNRMVAEGALRMRWLDVDKYRSGRWYLHAATATHQEDAAVQLFNWKKGIAGKAARAKLHNHYYLDSTGQCIV
jgi:Nucleotide-diphospho-sugar transferase